MIDTNQLMKGNLIAVKNDIVKVLEVGEDTVKYEFNNKKYGHVKSRAFTPILISDQWIIDFRIGQKDGSCPFSANFNRDKEGYFIWCGGFKIYVEYVHELQNLYHSLTKKQLTKYQ